MAVSDDDIRGPVSALRYNTNRSPGFGLRKVSGYGVPVSASSPARSPSVGGKRANPLANIRAGDGSDRDNTPLNGRDKKSYADPSEALNDIVDIGRVGMTLASFAGGVTGMPVGMAAGAFQGLSNIGTVNSARNSVGLGNMGAWDSVKSGFSADSAKEQVESIMDNDHRSGGAPGYGASGRGPLGDYGPSAISSAGAQSDAQAAENDAQNDAFGGGKSGGDYSGGGSGEDFSGGIGSDDLSGGNDTISGGGGDDLTGGVGSDNLSGGASGAGGGGSRVICTHMMRIGFMDKELWRADSEYTAHHASPTTVRGYHYWAIPYVRLMRRNDTIGRMAVRFMEPIARNRAEELAYQLGTRTQPNYLGKLVRLILEPMSWVIGCAVAQKDWRGLYSEKGAKP